SAMSAARRRLNHLNICKAEIGKAEINKSKLEMAKEESGNLFQLSQFLLSTFLLGLVDHRGHYRHEFVGFVFHGQSKRRLDSAFFANAVPTTVRTRPFLAAPRPAWTRTPRLSAPAKPRGLAPRPRCRSAI